jgi:hypothetical protein
MADIPPLVRRPDCEDPYCDDEVICDACLRACVGDAFVDEFAGSGEFVDKALPDGGVVRSKKPSN